MKKFFFTKRLALAVASALTLLLGGFTNQAKAASFDPTVGGGDWDFYLTGDQKGVAHMTFLPDFTLSGIQIMSPGKVPNVLKDNGRGVIDNPEDPRGVGQSNFVFLTVGAQVITGFWGYDFNGKVLGAVSLFSDTHTNGLTIRGSGKTGKHMTLRANLDDLAATVMYHGVPRVTLFDISGTYFVSGKKTKKFTGDSEPFTEIMTVTASGSTFPSGTPNFYDVVKFGPGYVSDVGFAILTANKRLGIYSKHQYPGSFTNIDGRVITSLSGEFKTNKLSGKVTGFDGTNFLTLKIGSPPP